MRIPKITIIVILVGVAAVVVAAVISIPERLLIQWHITNRCNLRCQHCYQDDYSNRGFQFSKLMGVAKQFFALHHQFSALKPNHPFSITLTGGEPFSYPDFMQLFEYLSTHDTKPRLAILTNGSKINEHIAVQLAAFKLRYVQLSVDGQQVTHDRIRGRGNFEQVIKATQFLKKQRIRVLWSFTAHQDNYLEFPEVAKVAQQY